MAIDPLTAAFEIGKTLIGRIWPDPEAQAEQMFKLQELRSRGDLAELNAEVVSMQGQLSINAQEAGHKSVFVAGWRPFVGWVGGFSLAYAGILEPLMRFIATMNGYTGLFPVIDTALTIQVLMGMLGLGAMRSFDKKSGTQTDTIKRK